MTTRTEWLNENAYRAFPFEEDSDMSSSDGAVLPAWAVLDARAVVVPHSSDEPVSDRPVRLRSFSVGEVSDGAAAVALTFSVERPRGGTVTVSSSARPGETRTVSASADLPGASCSLMVCTGAPADWGACDGPLRGSHDMRSAPALLPSRCVVIPGGVGIDALYGNSGQAAVGRVHLRNGSNTSMRISGNEIILDVSPYAGKGYECPEEKGCDGIYFINGQRADTDGSFSIVGGPGIRVETGTHLGMPAVFVTTTSLVDSYARPR